MSTRKDGLGEAPAITLPYNPETFTSTPSPQWTPQDTAGVEFPSSDWTGNKPRRWKLKHTLQRYDGAQVETILTQLETWSERPTQSTNRPTLILAEWGPHNEIGHIENLQTRRLIFDSNLNTTWGEYEFDLVRNNTINVG